MHRRWRANVRSRRLAPHCEVKATVRKAIVLPHPHSWQSPAKRRLRNYSSDSKIVQTESKAVVNNQMPMHAKPDGINAPTSTQRDPMRRWGGHRGRRQPAHGLRITIVALTGGKSSRGGGLGVRSRPATKAPAHDQPVMSFSAIMGP